MTNGFSRLLRRAPGGALAVALLALSALPAPAWQTAHGDPDNTGFADVPTAPAAKPKTIPGLGTIVAGAGPVVAPSGTVYIANEQGWLMSFKPDGTAGWKRQISGNQMIVASPAIGSDGTIYVVGIARAVDGLPRDQQPVAATLHRFNASGAYLGQTMFPQHGGKGGATTASPNIWRFNGTEMVIVPAVYPGPVGGMIDVRLVGFSPSGSLVVDQSGSGIAAETTGGGLNVPSWWLPICITPPIGTLVCYIGPAEFGKPGSGLVATMPGVGIFTNPQGGTPWILLSDHNMDLVGLTYSVAENKFYENFRNHETTRYLRSAPTILPNGHAVIGFEDFERDYGGKPTAAQTGGILFSGPNLTKVAPVTGQQEIYAAPTRLKDGRVVLVGAQGLLTVLNNVTVAGKFRIAGKSIVPAAASRTHFFVSAANALHTYDAATLTEVAKMDWRNGGMSPPVIGPQGHVYAIAGDQLMVFPPPAGTPTPKTGVFQDSGLPAPVENGGVFQEPGTSTPTGTSTGTATGGVFQAEGIPAPTSTGGIFQAEGIPAPASTGGVFQAEETSTAKTKQAVSYKPPLSKNGYRLFACLELDGDDCGKQDHREIAKQYCVKEGYGAAQEFDVETRKTKAETLTGDEYCSKKKCKVFEEIVCKM